MKKSQKIVGKMSSICLIITFFVIMTNSAHARIVFKNEFLIEDNGSDTFIIDSGDDVTGDISLQFGNGLAENITFDTGNSWFSLSDDLGIEGTSITLDTDNVGAGANVEIVANQGVDQDGILRYNATTNIWEVSSDGGISYDDLNDNTLDSAYDEGGAGAGRTITADTGTVQINGDGLEVDNILTNGNMISSTNLNGAITLDPNGTGNLIVNSDVDINGTNITYDADGPGGGADITLTFGGTLAETLQWDNTNTRFTVSDDFRVEGNHAVIGSQFVADDHAAVTSDGSLNLGRSSSNWENITFDSANLEFDISDSIHLTDTSGTVVSDWIALDDGTNEATIMSGTQDPTIVATEADTGSLFLNTDTGRLYMKEDDGNTINWLPSGLDLNVYDALDGTFGTPGPMNKFVTDTDPRLAATAGGFGEIALGTRLDYDTESNMDQDNIQYARVFFPANSTVQAMGFYTTTSSNIDVNLGIYDDNNGPNDKLAETGTQVGVNTLVDGFNEFNLTGPLDITVAGFYWVAMIIDGGQPKSQTYPMADSSFIPFKVETSNNDTTLPATATPTDDASFNLPYFAAFE